MIIGIIATKDHFDIITDINDKFHHHTLKWLGTSSKKPFDQLTKEPYQAVIIDLISLDIESEAIVTEMGNLRSAFSGKIIIMVAGIQEPELYVHEFEPFVDGAIYGTFDANVRKTTMEVFNQVLGTSFPSDGLTFQSSTPANQDDTANPMTAQTAPPASPANPPLPPEEIKQNVFNHKKREDAYQTLPIKKDYHHTLTVAIAGITERIGTTTQALQILNYLQQQHKRVCYLEMDLSGQIADYNLTYGELVEHDPNIGCVKCRGMDLYYLPQMITEIARQEYDVIIYDFGAYPNLSEEMKLLYLEKNVRIMVCGAKPSEIYDKAKNRYQSIFSQLKEQDIYYIFSFVHPNDTPIVREAMGNQGDKSFCCAYTPSYFNFSVENQHFLEVIFAPHLSLNPLQDTNRPISKKRRKWPWKK